MSLSKEDIAIIRDIVLDALDQVVNPRFDRIEQKLDEHDKRFDRIEQQLDEHSQILAEHGHRLTAIEHQVDVIAGRLEALEHDVKELYQLAAQPLPVRDRKFAKLPPEDRVRRLYADVQQLAHELHVVL